MLLMCDIGSTLQVDLITPRRESMSVNYLIILALFASFRTRSYIVPAAGGGKGAGIRICPSIYRHKQFILQKS